jgi:hypothetical protein
VTKRVVTVKEFIIIIIIIIIFTAIGFAPGGSSPTLVQEKIKR